jgi:hypothetical protein
MPNDRFDTKYPDANPSIPVTAGIKVPTAEKAEKSTICLIVGKIFGHRLITVINNRHVPIAIPSTHRIQ